MAEYRPAIALREHILDQNPVTPLESMLLFGVQNPNAELARMRKDGYIVKSDQFQWPQLYDVLINL